MAAARLFSANSAVRVPTALLSLTLKRKKVPLGRRPVGRAGMDSRLMARESLSK